MSAVRWILKSNDRKRKNEKKRKKKNQYWLSNLREREMSPQLNLSISRSLQPRKFIHVIIRRSVRKSIDTLSTRLLAFSFVSLLQKRIVSFNKSDWEKQSSNFG